MHGAAAAGYGYGPGFGFVDSDGKGQQIGYGHDYSKAGFQQEITEETQHAAGQGHQGFVEPDKKQAL